MSPLNGDKQHVRGAVRHSNSAAAEARGGSRACSGSPGRGGRAAWGWSVRSGLGTVAGR